MECNTAVIDLDSIMFTAAHPEKELDEWLNPIRKDGKFVYKEKSIEEMQASADFIMQSVLAKCNATSYIAFIKGKGNFRYEHNTEYKANRPKESPIWWKELKQYFIDKWNAVEVNGIEVDDAVNITRLAVPDSFIVALDKDLLSLEGTHYNWKKEEWITSTNEEAYLTLWTDMIVGQSGDNIKGLPGKGEKFVKKLIEQAEDMDVNTSYLCFIRELVFEEYLKQFGEYKGIQEFHKNYMSLKILENYEGFVIPEISKLNNEVKEDLF